MGKLRRRTVKHLARGHTASKSRIWDLNPGLYSIRELALYFHISVSHNYLHMSITWGISENFRSEGHALDELIHHVWGLGSSPGSQRADKFGDAARPIASPPTLVHRPSV